MLWWDLASHVGSRRSRAQHEPLSTTARATPGTAPCGGSAYASAGALPCRAVAPPPRASVARLSLSGRHRRGGGPRVYSDGKPERPRTLTEVHGVFVEAGKLLLDQM